MTQRQFMDDIKRWFMHQITVSMSWGVLRLNPPDGSLLREIDLFCLCDGRGVYSLREAWSRLECWCSLEKEPDHPSSFQPDKDNSGRSWGLSLCRSYFSSTSTLTLLLPLHSLKFFDQDLDFQAWVCVWVCACVFCTVWQSFPLQLYPVFPQLVHNGSVAASLSVCMDWLTAGCQTAWVFSHPDGHEGKQL